MSAFAFASPWLLLGLMALPIIWWLLRVTPPRPQQELFPPFELLKQLFTKEDTPHKSPWWLTLIRLLMAAAIIFALARPILNPNNTQAIAGDYLALVVDNGWASAPQWDAMLQTSEAVLEKALDGNKPVFLALTADDRRQEIGPFGAEDAMQRLRAASPQAVPNDRAMALGLIAETAQERNIELTALDIIIVSDGSAADLAAMQPQLAQFGGDVQLYGFDGPLPPVILSAQNGADGFSVALASNDLPLRLAAKDEAGRVIAEIDVSAGAEAAEFVLPFELRNDFAQITLEGQAHSGAVLLLDESNRRRRIGLLSASNADDGQPLLAPLYYINRALAPIADLIVPEEATFDDNLNAVLEREPSVIILADIGAISDAARAQLSAWLDAGGTLIRFAGPRLAASVTTAPDPLLPVILRQGERSLGGALSWAEPQKLVAFTDNSPFADLALPRDVEVKRQVLAQPTADILERSWAVLADGTPLVTGKAEGEGSLVLFHVAPDATWSNLPISGSYVDLLSRLTQLSKGRVISAEARGQNSATVQVPAWQILNGGGVLQVPGRAIAPLDGEMMTAPVSYASPPGLYGNAEGFVARNLFMDGQAPEALPATLEGAVRKPLIADAAQALAGPLWLGALALFLADCLAVLALGGAFRRGRRPAAVVALLAAFMLASPLVEPSHAQAISAEDQAKIDQLSVTRLAYVLTGDAAVDATTKAGMEGLTAVLQARTSIEPGPPIGLDLASDILAFYPMLYFPIEPRAPLPSEAALQQLDRFMREGGSVLFDTRDGLQSSFGGQSLAAQRLRQIVENLNIPPLEPVPDDHVLRRSFYILPAFAGRYANSPMWVETLPDEAQRTDRPVRQGDGVSSVLITGNDLAAAWAIGANGAPLYATVPPDPRQREVAYRTGVNIIMYMLTGNYKADQVHIPALLERLGQ